MSAGDGCIPDLWAHEVLSSAWRHCWAHGWVWRDVSSLLVFTGDVFPPSTTCQSAAHSAPALNELLSFKICTVNPVESISVIQRLELSLRVRRWEKRWFISLSFAWRDPTCFSSLSNLLVGRGDLAGVGVCRNLGEGLSLPSHEDGSDLWLTGPARDRHEHSEAVSTRDFELLVYAFFDLLSVGGEEEQDSVTQQVGRSHGGEMWVHPWLSIIQLSWGMLGANIGIEAPREGRRWQSAPFHWAFWDSGFAEAPLSPSSGHQCFSKRWNLIKNREEPPKCVLEKAIRGK